MDVCSAKATMATPDLQEASRAAAGPGTGEAVARTSGAASPSQTAQNTQAAAPATQQAQKKQDEKLFTLGRFPCTAPHVKQICSGLCPTVPTLN